MKTLGLIGGIGPESTIEYYRLLTAVYRERNDGNYPPIVINSINLKKYLDWITANELRKFTDDLVVEVETLAHAGVDFAAFASNTPHIVFDEIQSRSSIPLISIVAATCDRVQSLGLKRIGLFGTRFTMQGSFYPDTFSRAGIEVIIPDDAQRTYIHTIYIGELLNNIFLPATRERLLAIADDLKARHDIEGLILGGTELPLLLRLEQFPDGLHHGIQLLDTTRIHVDRLIKEMME